MIEIRPLVQDDYPAIKNIYDMGIAAGNATFETQSPEWEIFDKKFLPHSRFVSLEENTITGWVVLSNVSPRECYKGVCELTLYVHDDFKNKGIGKALIEKVIVTSEKHGYWSMLAVIHNDNPASIHLHEKCGFRMIGYRERIAFLNGVWKTTVIMEKRSNTIGI
ncbi:MAG: N-acetyltransferase [Bacteroidetes bacterium]|nr:N-acetyltransferase [Bacteroidota bacterium]MBK8486438.1 N-acetyltransferase [Bacteroidota bacterium]MBP8753150.1 N-acetyltransferase [Chitinophagales bacterium]